MLRVVDAAREALQLLEALRSRYGGEDEQGLRLVGVEQGPALDIDQAQARAQDAP
jgi:hypothetical protein